MSHNTPSVPESSVSPSRSHSPLCMYPETSASFIWMSSSQPSNVQEPNLSSHRWMSNGNHRTSTLHVLVKIPGKESEWGQVWGDKAGREKAGTPKPTWRQIFTVATGVHQHVGLEGGIKLVMSAVAEQQSDVSGSTAASRAADMHRTCCRAVCQASTPGRVWSEDSLLRDTLTGSTGGSGRTIAGRRNSSIWINKCTNKTHTRPYFSSNLDFAWHALSGWTAASSVFIRFMMRSEFCAGGMEGWKHKCLYPADTAVTAELKHSQHPRQINTTLLMVITVLTICNQAFVVMIWFFSS